MPRPTARKDHPLSMRMPQSDLSVIDRAAGLRGRSRTDFIREAAVRAAEETIMENTLIRMSPKGFAHFLQVLSEPPKIVPEIVAVMTRKAPWETENSKD